MTKKGKWGLGYGHISQAIFWMFDKCVILMCLCAGSQKPGREMIMTNVTLVDQKATWELGSDIMSWSPRMEGDFGVWISEFGIFFNKYFLKGKEISYSPSKTI